MSHLRWNPIAEKKASRPNKIARCSLREETASGIHNFMTVRIDIKRKVGCLALGLATFLAAMYLSAAETNETARLCDMTLGKSLT